MIPSTNIRNLHELFSGITPAEWAFFAWGVIGGTAVWIFVYRQVLRHFFRCLQTRINKEVLLILVQSGMGAAIICLNVFLVNYGEMARDFVVWAFGMTGILFGLWIFVPAERHF